MSGSVKPIARTEFDERPVFASDVSFVGDAGLTKQADAKDCDINNIFRRFEKTGQLPEMIVRDPHYGDFSNVPDLQKALEITRHAQAQFDALDVAIRNRFENDPVKFHAFVSDPANIDEVEKMGLLKPEAVKARAEARAAVQKAEADAQKAAKAAAPLDPEYVAKLKAALGL